MATVIATIFSVGIVIVLIFTFLIAFILGPWIWALGIGLVFFPAVIVILMIPDIKAENER